MCRSSSQCYLEHASLRTRSSAQLFVCAAGCAFIVCICIDCTWTRPHRNQRVSPAIEFVHPFLKSLRSTLNTRCASHVGTQRTYPRQLSTLSSPDVTPADLAGKVWSASELQILHQLQVPVCVVALSMYSVAHRSAIVAYSTSHAAKALL